jgi:hypothetical protein
VHGGPNLDLMFQTQILEIMYTELELRLSGERPSEVGSRPPINLSPIPQPNAPTPGMPRDGVCFQSLAHQHGLAGEDDDHGMCLCQLTTCLGCFHAAAQTRKGPISLLPYELANTSVSSGWTGGVESSAQAQARRSGFYATVPKRQDLPAGQGFTRNTKSQHVSRPPPMFPHPQMTDVLAVEEHLRWRLKEMGAADPAVEARYGPSTNAPAALEGVDLPELDDPSEDGSVRSVPITANGPPKGKLVKVSRGKGKVRRVVNGVVPPKKREDASGKKDEKSKALCYLPKEWAEADPSVRSTAIVLTFRHFVRVSAQSGSLSHAKPDPLIAATAPRRGHHVPLLLPFLSQRYCRSVPRPPDRSVPPPSRAQRQSPEELSRTAAMARVYGQVGRRARREGKDTGGCKASL